MCDIARRPRIQPLKPRGIFAADARALRDLTGGAISSRSAGCCGGSSRSARRLVGPIGQAAPSGVHNGPFVRDVNEFDELASLKAKLTVDWRPADRALIDP
jgi:hypothetical protein